jgi:flagellar hook-associated protein 2
MASTSATSGITFSNFTGIDFNSILTAETAAAQVPITAEQNQLVGVNTAISTLGSISGDFTTLQNALATLNTSLTIPPTGATVSAGAPFTASVTGAPINGTYSVNVSKLAQAQSVASQGYLSNTSSVGDGTISIAVGGAAPTTITVDSTNDTLDGLASAINSTANIGVTAQVVNTGAPGAPYRLELTSNSTGTAAAFSVSSNLAGGTSPDFANAKIGPTDSSSVTGTSTPTIGGSYTGSLSQGYQFSVVSGGTIGTDPITLKWTSDSGESGTLNIPANASGPTAVADGLTVSLWSGTLNTGDSFSVAAFVPQVSNAQNATVQVGNQIIVSQTNTVSNAISGVLLQLNNTGANSSVTVAPDLATEGNNINAFVTAYNTAIGDIVQTTQAVPKQTAPALAGDGGLRSTMFNMQSQLGSLNLASLGITVNQQTGDLVFTQASFVASETSNPTAVNQSISGLYSALNSMVSGVVAPDTGLIATETSSYNAEQTSINTKLTEMNNDLANYTAQLQAQYATIQATVAGYQSIAQLFTAISSNGSSSTSSSSTGSTLSMTG